MWALFLDGCSLSVAVTAIEFCQEAGRQLCHLLAVQYLEVVSATLISHRPQGELRAHHSFTNRCLSPPQMIVKLDFVRFCKMLV